jgi:hypothetical protein
MASEPAFPSRNTRIYKKLSNVKKTEFHALLYLKESGTGRSREIFSENNININ